MVASEKASEVCPEGNDRLAAGVNTVKPGSLSAGLGRLNVLFKV